LPKHNFDKLFTLEEAAALIPTLELQVREVQQRLHDLRGRIATLLKDDPAIGRMDLPEIVQRHPELRETAARMAELAGAIAGRGCFLKDVDLGLIDFPWAIDDDHVVFLCWQPGEPDLVAWHTVESGFAQRQPLPGVTKPYLN
jgi:hypothetical protein